jgi:hypothetical protein
MTVDKFIRDYYKKSSLSQLGEANEIVFDNTKRIIPYFFEKRPLNILFNTNSQFLDDDMLPSSSSP